MEYNSHFQGAAMIRTKYSKQCDVIPAVNQLETHVYFQKWEFQRGLEQKGTVMQAWAPLAQGIGNISGNETLRE